MAAGYHKPHRLGIPEYFRRIPYFAKNWHGQSCVLLWECQALFVGRFSMENQGFRYSVLFVRTEKQSEVCSILSGAFPREHGKIFLPMREYYRRDRKENDTKPLFPGYLFVHSDMDRRGLHEFLLEQRQKIPSFLRELGLGTKELSGEMDWEDAGIVDLTPEESSFLDQMLDEKGIQRMSAGYRENSGKTVVMEGPLKEFSQKIVRIDRHERLAYLSLKFREFDVMAGLEIKPKKHYFPEDENAPAVLSDGTEVDIQELKKRMTQG